MNHAVDVLPACAAALILLGARLLYLLGGRLLPRSQPRTSRRRGRVPGDRLG